MPVDHRTFDLFRGEPTLADLVDHAVDLLRANVPEDGQPYWGCFSGGKDSIVIKQLAAEAGVPIEWWYAQTTIDPPELIWYIKKHHADVQWQKPRHGNFFVRMERKKGFPTRRSRWCCDEYKETATPRGRVTVMGLRAEESARRAARWSEVDYHTRTRAAVVNPILFWSSDEVWEFIRDRELPYCELYDEGFHRLGCVGCPMARESGKRRAFDRWPRFEARWKLSFKRIWERKAGTKQKDGREWFGSAYFRTWEEMWNWWCTDKPLPRVKLVGGDQRNLDFDLDD